MDGIHLPQTVVAVETGFANSSRLSAALNWGLHANPAGRIVFDMGDTSADAVAVRQLLVEAGIFFVVR
jgi:hypothetical protein